MVTAKNLVNNNILQFNDKDWETIQNSPLKDNWVAIKSNPTLKAATNSEKSQSGEESDIAKPSKKKN